MSVPGIEHVGVPPEGESLARRPWLFSMPTRANTHERLRKYSAEGFVDLLVFTVDEVDERGKPITVGFVNFRSNRTATSLLERSNNYPWYHTKTQLWMKKRGVTIETCVSFIRGGWTSRDCEFTRPPFKTWIYDAAVGMAAASSTKTTAKLSAEKVGMVMSEICKLTEEDLDGLLKIFASMSNHGKSLRDYLQAKCDEAVASALSGSATLDEPSGDGSSDDLAQIVAEN